MRGDDLANLRYVLQSPEGVYPLPGKEDSEYFITADQGQNYRTESSIITNCFFSLELYPDFFPWHKTKEEDSLAVEYVPRGYFQAAEVSNETGSACASMLPLFKQWTSTPALSYFLVKSMQTREKSSRLDKAWAFKPPPRATLNGQMREAWLQDLASPNVPLRKLGRTIPHGIRHRSLLEQCCAREIPVSRAVWCARCVGIAEMRNRPRRGNVSSSQSSSDTLWIREWTKEVIDFFEKNLKSCGEAVLKGHSEDSNSGSLPVSELRAMESKLSYLTNLVSYLFLENLLDRAVFLKWVIRYLQSCGTELLVVALMFTKLYWEFIVRSPNMSQELAYIFIERYQQLSELQNRQEDDDTISDLMASVEQAMRDLFVVSPSSFVMPKHWADIEPILTTAFSSDSTTMSKLLETVKIRNESLAVCTSSDTPKLHGWQLALSILDSINNIQEVKTAAKSVPAALNSNWNETLNVVFGWACTASRSSDTIIYVAVALCEEWNEQNLKLDISSCFVDFLLSLKDVFNYSMDHVCLLCTELLRTDMFRVNEYLRKLIALGVLFVPRLQAQAEIQIMIMKNIPSGYGDETFLKQRDIMLSRFKANAASSPQNIEDKNTSALNCIKQHLPFLFEQEERAEDDFSPSEHKAIRDLNMILKIEMAESIVAKVEQAVSDDFSFTLTQVAMIHRSLTALGDYRALYHCIWKILQQVQHASVLYFLAHSISGYYTLFDCLGQLPELIQLFISQISNLQNKSKTTKGLYDLVGFFSRQFASSNSDLKTELDQLLQPALGSSPQDISTFSPLSEGLLPETPSSHISLDMLGNEQVDSGSLPKFFAALASQFLTAFEKYPNNVGEPGQASNDTRTLVNGLQKLRELDMNRFDELFTAWLRDEAAPKLAPDAMSFSMLLVLCLVYECASLDRIADVFMQLKSNADEDKGSEYLRILQNLVGTSGVYDKLQLSVAEKICFETQCRMFQFSKPSVYLRYIASELTYRSKQHDGSSIGWFGDIDFFLKSICCTDITAFVKSLVDPILQTKDIKLIKSLGDLINYLLGSAASFSNINFEYQLMDLIKIYNCYNINLCQMKMRVLVTSVRLSLDDNSQSTCVSMLVSSLLNCAAEAIQMDIGKRVLGDILVWLDSDVRSAVFMECERLFLSSEDAPQVMVRDCNVAESITEIVDTCTVPASDVIHWDMEILMQFMARLFSKLDSLAANILKESVEETAVKSSLEDSAELAAMIRTSEANSENGNPADSVLAKSVRKTIEPGLLLLIKIVMVSFQHPGSQIDSESKMQILASFTRLEQYTSSGGILEGLKGILDDVITVLKEGCKHPVDKHTNDKQAASTEGNSVPVNDFEETYLFNLLLFDRSSESYSAVNVRSFDLLEYSNFSSSKSNQVFNDAPLDLALFDTTVERKNPG